MPVLTAGILMYRRAGEELQVLLVHFGGPYWRNRDEGAWGIPKGVVEDGEEPADAARREFAEELGSAAEGQLQPLCRIRQAGGKWVEAFALEGNLDTAHVVSNTFSVEWPPKSGQMKVFPEVDRAEWLSLATARRKILPSQQPVLDHLEAALR